MGTHASPGWATPYEGEVKTTSASGALAPFTPQRRQWPLGRTMRDPPTECRNAEMSNTPLANRHAAAASGCIEVRGAREQPEECRCLHSTQCTGGVLRRVGVRQVLAGLRHGLRRGAAALLESVAPYARRLIDQAGVPDVDAIDGLPPAVALQQQRGASNARSSVGSVTTLSSLVRMMYSRAGPTRPTSPCCTPKTSRPTPHRCLQHLPRPGTRLRGDRSADGAGPIAEHPRARHRLLAHRHGMARTCATSWSLGYDIDVPWKKLPKKDRDWILFTEKPRPCRSMPASRPPRPAPRSSASWSQPARTPAHAATCCTPCQHPERADARVCPCHGRPAVPRLPGKRLKPEALSVTFAGDIGEFMWLPLDQLVLARAHRAGLQCTQPRRVPAGVQRPAIAPSGQQWPRDP